jgi:hypothetical protein
VPAICPAKSEANSLNPSLLGTFLGPTKSLLLSIMAAPIARNAHQVKTNTLLFVAECY